MLTKSGYYKKNVENCNMWRILTNEVLSLCGYWKQKNTMNDRNNTCNLGSDVIHKITKRQLQQKQHRKWKWNTIISEQFS